jgi:methionyl-tRNA formyltransferase
MTPTTRIIFMGTPLFAVSSLRLLVEQKYSVVAVVTAPDKPQGRGQSTLPSPIKLFAQQEGIPVLQPTNLQDEEFVRLLDSYQADLYVVVAFRMLPKVVWSKPALGTINLHASLLPQYRGAAPINWAIAKGEKLTGVTTFFIEETIDTGKMLLQDTETIYTVDTVGTLSERLQHKGAKLLVKTIQAIEEDRATPTTQVVSPADLLKKAPKIYTEDCQINWNQPTEIVYNFIRGLSPHPGAWTMLNGMHTKILTAYPLPYSLTDPGTLCSDGKNYLYVGTHDGTIGIETLQVAGKKALDVQAFLRGCRLSS